MVLSKYSLNKTGPDWWEYIAAYSEHDVNYNKGKTLKSFKWEVGLPKSLIDMGSISEKREGRYITFVFRLNVKRDI